MAAGEEAFLLVFSSRCAFTDDRLLQSAVDLDFSTLGGLLHTNNKKGTSASVLVLVWGVHNGLVLISV